MTGVVPFLELASPAPIAVAIDRMALDWANVPLAVAPGGELNLMSFLIKIGAITGLSSVMLVLCFGQTRVFYTMARDGLLPRAFALVHRKFRTPVDRHHPAGRSPSPSRPPSCPSASSATWCPWAPPWPSPSSASR